MMAIAMFVYAVVGVQLFGSTRRGLYLNEVYNFDNAGNGLLTLWRFLFGT